MKSSSNTSDLRDSSLAPAPLRWALANLSLTMLLASLGTSIANVGLPTIARVFDASFQDVQWVVLAYLLAITTLIVSVGRLGDLIGRHKLMLIGIALFTLASITCALSSTLQLLIIARAFQGLGAAIIMSLTMAFVGDIVPKEKTGSAMGLLGTMSAIGTALGPSLGGLLITAFGWRSIFFINLPLGIIALALAFRYLPQDRILAKSDRPHFDGLGTLILASTLGLYALAMTVGRGNFGFTNYMLLLAAGLGVGLFIWAESKVPSPLIRLEIFKISEISAGFITSAIVATVMMATLVVGPFYLTGAFALNAALVGLVMATGPIVASFTGVPSGRIVDRFGSYRTTLTGLGGMLAGLSALVIIPTDFGVSGYIAPLMLLTASYALFQVSNNTAVMVNITSDQRGVVSGMLSLSRNLGLVTGASAMGAVFAFGSKTTTLFAQSAPVASGMKLTFAAAAFLIAIAILCAVFAEAVNGSKKYAEQGFNREHN